MTIPDIFHHGYGGNFVREPSREEIEANRMVDEGSPVYHEERELETFEEYLQRRNLKLQ